MGKRSRDRRGFDLESEHQDHMRRDLLDRIAEAKRRGRRYVLEGAKEISLYVHHDTRRWRDVCNAKRGLPIYRSGGGMLRMDPELYDTLHHLEQMCSALGLDFTAEVRRRGLDRLPVSAGSETSR